MSQDKNTRLVTGLFADRASAERAYHHATERGYTKDDINVLMSDDTRKRYFTGDDTIETELGTKAAEGAGIGAGVGGAIGAALAAVAAVGTSLVLPGLGIVIAGPLAAAVAGAGAGGITGGLLGALIGAGIPEERVKHYEEGLKQGGIVMGVNARSDEDAAHLESGWKDNAGQHVIGTGVGAAGGAAAGLAAGSPAGPIGMAAGAIVGGIAGGLAGKGAAEVVNPKSGDDLSDHHMATGVGAGGGAMAGMAIGAAGGPIGMAAGGAIGAIAGGIAGKGVGGLVNPADEQRYWQDQYRNESYFNPAYQYDDYDPAYSLGYNSRGNYRGSWDQNETHLRGDWERVKGRSRLSWEEAKGASRAAWDKVERALPGDWDKDGK
ncbi:hypothetical protein IP91_04584 [Pseudoduganella lurida]|uniref:Glycine zipper domain-containing protein n=1 Tax=Pseudoduganella lurida TaxID=1036180 RepID=A0A562QYV0_9BURK|nr:hypothetical protein [Pseudoduganella lurida]TWI61504.1 hypothetical protein IP91_04584 [Pseudoduganella lurida]